MPELLLELFSEEIPARLQTRAAEELRRLMVEGLKARGLEVGEAKSFATPRRLALVVEDVPKKSPAVSEERKGPRVGAPEQAIAGFLKGAGLKSIKEAQVVSDEKKGDYYVAKIEKPGRAAAEIVAEVLRETILGFPWPKTMRWQSPHFVLDDYDEYILDDNGRRNRWRVVALDLAAALDPALARRQSRALRDRRHKVRQHDARPPLPRQRAVQGDGLC